jgi:RHS repeat-associated protein
MNNYDVTPIPVYGQVGASDASHPNRFMFTGREFDKETGLYYYRARYYKPEIGRFLQADEVGYEAGMNLYCYCSNNPWNSIDPYGLEPNEPNEPNEPCIPIDPIPVYPPIAGPDPAGPPLASPGTGGGGDPNDPNWNCTCICCGSGGPGAPGFGPPGWVNPSHHGRDHGGGDEWVYGLDPEKLKELYKDLGKVNTPEARALRQKVKRAMKYKDARHHRPSPISTCVAALAEAMRESSQDLKDPHNVIVLTGCACLCILVVAAAPVGG